MLLCLLMWVPLCDDGILRNLFREMSFDLGFFIGKLFVCLFVLELFFCESESYRMFLNNLEDLCGESMNQLKKVNRKGIERKNAACCWTKWVGNFWDKNLIVFRLIPKFNVREMTQTQQLNISLHLGAFEMLLTWSILLYNLDTTHTHLSHFSIHLHTFWFRTILFKTFHISVCKKFEFEKKRRKSSQPGLNGNGILHMIKHGWMKMSWKYFDMKL